MDEEEQAKKKVNNKRKQQSAMSQTSEAVLVMNNLNANTNVFSQLSAMYLQKKESDTGEKSIHEDFIKKQEDKGLTSFNQFDSVMQKILQSLNKKNEVTKLKGLILLKEELNNRKPDFFFQFIETWTYLYKTFMNSEFDRKILEECNNILTLIIQKNKKCLQSQFKILFPAWLLAMNDQNKDVSKIAQNAFSLVFVPEKREAAFMLSVDNYVLTLQNVLQQTGEKLMEENSNLDEFKATEVCERICISALYSIIFSINLLTNINQMIFVENLKVLAFEVEKNSDKTIFQNLLENKKRFRSRAACLMVLDLLLNKLQQEYIETKLELFSRSILAMLDDKERIVQNALWSGCILSLLKKAPFHIIQKCDMKMIEVKSLENAKRCASGIGAIFYQKQIVFLSLLPHSSFSDQEKEVINEQMVKEKWTYISKYLENLLQGFQHEEIKFFNNHLTISYFECIYFVTLKRIYPIYLDEKFVNLKKQAKTLVNSLIFNMINLYMENHDPNKAMNEYRTVPNDLAGLINNFLDSQFNKDFFSIFVFELNKLLKTCKDEPKKFLNFVILLQSISMNVTKNSVLFDDINTIILDTNKQLLENIIENDLSAKTSDLILNINIYKTFISHVMISLDKPLNHDLIKNQLENIMDKILILLEKLFNNVQQIASLKQLDELASILSCIFNHIAFKNQENCEQSLNFVRIILDRFNAIDQTKNESFLLNLIVIHLLDPNLPPDYFYQITSFKDIIQEQNYIQKQINQYEKARNDIQTLYSNIIPQEFSQNLYINVTKILFSLTNQFSKYYFMPVSVLLSTYINQERVKDVLLNFQATLEENKIQLIEKNSRSPHVLEKIEHSFLIANSVNKQFPSIKDIIIPFYKDFTQLIYTLHQQRNRTKVGVFYNLLKQILNNQNVFTLLIQSAKDTFQKILEDIFIQNQIKKLESFQVFMTEYFEFLNKNNKMDEIFILVDLCIKEKYFQNALYLTESWKFLKCLFEQVERSNEYRFKEFIKQLLFQQKQYWFFAYILSANSIHAIINNLRLRKFFIELNFNVIKPIIMESLNEKSMTPVLLEFMSFFQEQSQNKSLIFSNGLKILLKQMISEQLDQEVLKELFQLLVEDQIIEIYEESNLDIDWSRKGIILSILVPLFKQFLDNNDFILGILQRFIENQIANQSNDKSKIKFLIALNIISQIQVEMPNFQDKITKYLFDNFSDWQIGEFHQIAPNFLIHVVFEYTNFLIEKQTLEPFFPYLLILEKMFIKGFEFNAKMQLYSSSAIIKMLQFLRKILSVIEAFSTDFKQISQSIVMDTCIIKIRMLQNSFEIQDLDFVKDEMNDLLILEFAETISRFVQTVDQNLDENLVYEMMNSIYPPIQKSCFVLLRHFYATFIPSTNYKPKFDHNVEDYDQKLTDEIESLALQVETNPHLNLENMIKYLDITTVLQRHVNEEQETEEQKIEEEYLYEDIDDDKGIVDPNSYSFLMTWISFIFKINSPLQSDTNDIIKNALLTYLEINKQVYNDFLNVIFKWIEYLNCSEQEYKKYLKSEDIAKIEIEWSDYLSKESLVKLLVQSIYMFAIKFPAYLRQWVDYEADKKHVKLIEILIKTFISKAIFMKEVDTIEMSQHEWQSEEFNIYATRNTNEIFAVYTKEQQKLEIMLRVPSDYPMKQLVIECNKGVKINQMKMNKLMLRMKSLLFNQNNTIKDALLIFKQNLDKEFEGMEECPICYYVIHSTTKELPKLPCKTCHYKFHSSCIHKWFQSSNKSECPMCKSQFL